MNQILQTALEQLDHSCGECCSLSAQYQPELIPAARRALVDLVTQHLRWQHANSGAGKTLIALLICELWRRENKKVAVLSANKTLARQMVLEAAALGVPAVLMEGPGRDIPGADKRAYHRANSIAVMNYWVYFNQRPVLDPADLLVMDDAHLAEHCLNSLYSVEINKHDHEALFTSLLAELRERFPEYSIISDALAADVPADSTAELLSFLDQVSVADRIREIVDSSPYLETDLDLRFRWTRLRQQLNEANIYISLGSLWIRPYVYPLISNYQYQQTEQRLYVNATIGDPGDISRRLGSNGYRPQPRRSMPTFCFGHSMTC